MSGNYGSGILYDKPNLPDTAKRGSIKVQVLETFPCTVLLINDRVTWMSAAYTPGIARPVKT